MEQKTRVATSDPKVPPVRGLGGVKIVREKCPRMRARGSFSAQRTAIIERLSLFLCVSRENRFIGQNSQKIIETPNFG